MAEHFLNRPEVGAALEQMRGEGVAEEVGMDALGLEAGGGSELAQDEKGACSGQRPALGVEEELRPVAAVEVRPPAGEIPAKGLDRLAADGDDALLRALAEGADEPLLEIDGRAVEPDRLAHAQPGAVEELDERAVSERARRGPVRGLDQPFHLAGERVRGSVRGRRGSSSSAAGWSVRTPTRSWR